MNNETAETINALCVDLLSSEYANRLAPVTTLSIWDWQNILHLIRREQTDRHNNVYDYEDMALVAQLQKIESTICQAMYRAAAQGGKK